MNILLSRTAIVPPSRRADLISRPRLINLLRNLLKKKLILITTPPGYGKTSLLIDFVDHIKVPVCWYTLDRHHQDIRSFLAHFVAAIARKFPDFEKITNAILDEDPQTSSDPYTQTLLIANELGEQVHEDFIIVLDSFEFAGPDIRNFIDQFVQRIPDNCHLIIASQSNLDLPSLELGVVRSEISGLHMEDLAFTPEEVKVLAAQNHALQLSERDAAQMVEWTGGWITYLVLYSPQLLPEMVDWSRAVRTTGALFDRYLESYLREKPVQIQEFATYTCLFDGFDARFCSEVLGGLIYPIDTDWQSLIRQIVQHNVFVIPNGQSGTWLRYQEIFRDFLVRRLDKCYPRIKGQILGKLARVYTERGDWENAFDAYLDLGDVEALAKLVTLAGPIMITNGQFLTLKTWLEKLHGRTASSYPELNSLAGTLAMVDGDIEESIKLLTKAEGDFRKIEDKSGLARLLMRRSSAYAFVGNYQFALRDAQEACDLTEQELSLQSVRIQALKARGVSLHRMGKSAQAVQDMKQALELCEQLDDQASAANLNLELGPIYRSMGNIRAAQKAYQKAQTYLRSRGDLHRLSDLLNNRGVFYHCTSEYQNACQDLNEAYQMAHRVGFARVESFSLASLGDVFVDLDAFDAAREAYNRAAGVMKQTSKNRFLSFYLDFVKAGLARKEGNLAQAHHHLQSAWDQADQAVAYELGCCHLETGRLALVENDVQRSVDALKSSVDLFQQASLPCDETQARVYLAAALYLSGEVEQCLVCLERAISLANELHLDRALLSSGREVIAQIGHGFQNLGGGYQIDQWAEKVAGFEASIPGLRRVVRSMNLVIPFSPPKLQIRGFGETQVKLNGRLVSNNDWQSPRQRELFFFLLSEPKGVSTRNLMDNFWTNNTEARRQRNTMIYKIRAVLGKDVILFENDHFTFNRSLDYEYDVETFLSYDAQAKAETDLQRRANFYKQMLLKYQGAYLGDLNGSWITSDQERFKQMCAHACIKLAEFYLSLKDYPNVVEYSKEALKIDIQLEEAHRLIMCAHIGMGNIASAERQYQICRQTLADRLGITPSKEIEVVRRSYKQ